MKVFKMMRSLLYFLLFVAVVCSENVANSDNLIQTEEDFEKYLQSIEDTPSLPLFGNYIVLEKRPMSRTINTPNEDILERCARLLTDRELKITLPNSEARDLLSGARSKKIRRVILPLLLLLKLKAIIVLPIVLSFIALVSFKGFGLSLAALAVAGTTALKNILEHAGSKVSYEVVPTPVGHWSRSGSLDNSVPSGYQFQYQ